MVLEEVADIGSDLMTKSAALMKGPVQGMAIPTTGVLTYEDLDLQYVSVSSVFFALLICQLLC